MNNLSIELKHSDKINRSVKLVYNTLKSENYVVDYHKDFGNYFIDIQLADNQMAYIHFDRHENTVNFVHIPDINKEDKCFVYTATIEQLDTTVLLDVVRQIVR